MIPNGAKHHKYIHPAKWDEVFVGEYSLNYGSDVKYICYVLFIWNISHLSRWNQISYNGNSVIALFESVRIKCASSFPIWILGGLLFWENLSLLKLLWTLVDDYLGQVIQRYFKVFKVFYLVHSWIPWPIWSSQSLIEWSVFYHVYHIGKIGRRNFMWWKRFCIWFSALRTSA